MPQVLVFIVLKDVCRVLPILEVLLDVPHRVIEDIARAMNTKDAITSVASYFMTKIFSS